MDQAKRIGGGVGDLGYLSEQSGVLADYVQLIQQETGSIIPHREYFDPMHIPRLLPYILMLELKNERECVFRLVGNATVDRSGMNPQGQNYFDMLPEKIKLNCIRNLFMLFEQPCGSTGLQVETYVNGEAATVEVTSFPFIGKQGEKLIIATATEVFTDDHTIPRHGGVSLDHWPAHRFIDIGAGLPDISEP